MNNTFNINRFGLLIKRQWLEFGKIYLVTLAVVLGVFVTFYGYSEYKLSKYDVIPKDGFNGLLNFREPLFIIMGLLFISVIASNYFAHLGQKSKAIIDLLIPASTFEKFLTALFFTAVLTTASFMLLFYVTDLIFVSHLKSIITTEPYFFSKNNPNEFIPIYLVPFFTTSIFLLGSIYFEKFHYIKTAVAVMLFCGIWALIVINTSSWIMEGKIPVDIDERGFGKSKHEAEYLLFSLVTVLTLIFWSITYVRLKEKEV